jgi:hypothetical protein
MATVEQILRSSLTEVERLSALGGARRSAVERELLRDLEEADRRLAQQLRREAAAYGGQSARFTGASAVAYRQQIALQTTYLRQRLIAQTEQQALRAAKRGMLQLSREMGALAERFTGIVRPPRLAQAARMTQALAGTRSSLLRSIPTSFDRYGDAMISRFESTMRVGMVQGLTLDQMTAALTGHGGPRGTVSMAATMTPEGVLRLREEDIPEGLFRRYRSWAERIVRTESVFAYNGARHDGLRIMQQEDFPDLKRKIVAILDNRTASDSIGVNGQIRKLDEEFEDGLGRRYLYPPGRPNDRETVIPWRDVWAERATQAVGGASEVERATLGLLSEDETADLLNRIRARSAGNVPMLPRAPRPAPEPAAPVEISAGEAAELAEAERLFASGYTDGAEARAWAQGLTNAMNAGRRGAKMQATLRTGFRDRIKRTLGIESGDLARADGLRYRVKNLGENTWGLHTWQGEMQINSAVHRGAAAEMRSIAGAHPNTVLESSDVRFMRTHIHEEIHGCSPGHWTTYRARGILVEEIATEIQAREVARRLIRAPRLARIGGSYGRYINPVVEEMAEALKAEAIRARDLLTTRRRALRMEKARLDTLAGVEYDAGADVLSADLQAQITANEAAITEIEYAQRVISPEEMAIRRLREGSTELWGGGARTYETVEAFESAFTDAIAKGNQELAEAVTRGLDRARAEQLRTARKGYR